MARKKYTADRRSELLALFANRTESIASFAQTHSVSAATLYKWQGAREDNGAGSFVQIAPPEAASATVPGLTVWAGGVGLSFERLPPADWLASLVQKLQG
jgi:transposase-like protein